MKIDPDVLPPPKEPYRGVLPFRLLDWRIFFEREREAERLGNLISMYASVLLYGQSGTGKSSLLNAGLLPDVLRRGYAPERIRVFPDPNRALLVERIRLHEDEADSSVATNSPSYVPSRFTLEENDEPVAISCTQFLENLSKPSNLGVPLLIFDQFEEYITLFDETRLDKNRFAAAQQAGGEIENLVRQLLLSDPFPLKIIFAFRDDYFARLTALFSHIPDLIDHGVRLVLPDVELLHHIIRGPFIPSKERGIEAGQFRDELSEEVAQKIESGIRTSQPSGLVNLNEVQTLCLALWREPQRRAELLHAKDTPAVLRRIIESEAMAKLNQLRPWDRARAIAVLSNLVTEDGTRNVVSQQMLVSQTRRNPLLWIFRGDWRKFLSRLPKTGLVRRSLSSGTTYYYELASEFLIPRIQKWQQQLRMRRLIFLECICVVFALFVSLFWHEAYRAKKAERAAKKAERAAIETKGETDKMISYLEYDLNETFRKLGRIDMMKEINERVRTYYEKHPPKRDDLDGIRAQAKAIIQHAELLEREGRLEEVAKEQQAALRVLLKLGAQKPDDPDYQRGRYVGYNMVGYVRRAQGDLAGALKSYSESLAIAEKLAKRDRGNAEWQRYLSVSYNNIGYVQHAQGDLAGALKSYSESLAIAKKLAEEDSGNAEWQRDLSVSYNNIGVVKKAQGDFAGALTNYHDSLEIAKKLAEEDSGNAEWQRGLSASYHSIGDVLYAQGDLTGSLTNYKEGLAIWKKLATQAPGNAEWQRGLSASYHSIGDVLYARGDLTDSLTNFKEGLAIRKKLATQAPGSADWQRGLSVSHAAVGEVLYARGDLDGALKSYRDYQAIMEKLVEQYPGNADWQRALSVSFEKIGEVLYAQGDLDGALKSYRDSLDRREKLTQQDPSNAGWQSELSGSFEKIGNVLRAQGDLSGASTKYQESFAIREKLAKQDSGNAGWQSELSSSFEKIGNVLRAQGDLSGAFSCCQKSFAIREKLTKQDPSNASWQSDLSRSFEKIGTVLRDQGDLNGALKNYRAGFAILEKLAKQDPHNASWQADLGYSYFHVGLAQSKVEPNSKQQAQMMMTKGRDILRDLKKRNFLTAEQQKWLDQVESELSKAEKAR
jgi:tetratricopeptide (TPR) repeat protein